MQHSDPDHYAALGLDHQCTDAQIRAAYRLLAKQHHPDVNHGAPGARPHIQEINAAYEALSDPARRDAYDRARNGANQPAPRARTSKIKRDISQDVHLRIEDFLRGASLEVRVKDPANSRGLETYQLSVPPETAPGKIFRVPRGSPFAGGFVLVRTRVAPNFRFKVRGLDLRCDLRISAKRAAQGGPEMIAGVPGARLRVQIPPGVARGEMLRLPGEGLPKPRGGRGDLLVRIIYQPEVRISRTSGR